MKRFRLDLYVRTHLKNEIFFLITFVCILQAAIIGFVTWHIYTRQLFDREKENLTQLLNVVNQDLDSRIESVNSIALDIVINNEIKSNLNKENPLEVGRAKNIVNSILSKKFLSASNDLIDLSIIDLQNNTYSTRATYFLPRDFHLQDTDVFKIAETYNGALVWLNDNSIIDHYGGDSIFPSNHLDGLRAAALIKDYTQGKILGLLMVSIKENFFSAIDYSNSKLKSVNMYMVSPNAQTILPVAGSNGTLSGDIIPHIDATKERDTIIMADSEKTLVSYIQNVAMGWALVSTIASANINRSFSYIIRTLIITIILSICLSILISWLFTSIMMSGIDDLSRTMKLVEQGNFDVQINSKRRDELGSLSRVFDQMMRNIKDLINKTYKQQLLTQEAEFKALQAQINPHFLYNTLDMINWRLLANGQDDISKSVVELGMILQYSMSAKAVVSLQEELQNVENYLALRKANRDPDFLYSISQEGGQNVRLPKLTLQPLVENAILHGFGQRRSGNELKIRAFPVTAHNYRIEIMDNGVGMDDETLHEALAGKPEQNEKAYPPKMHIGIKNVDERIKYRYGAAFGVSVTSQYGFGTTVSILVSEDGSKLVGLESVQ
ncbi:MAG: two-component system sensor histidine kinase YesM [Rectinema sp.]